MSTVINHYRVNYLASHLQFWYIRESLARRSPTAELVLWNFPLHELQKGTWTRTEWFLWCYYGARYPWHRQSAFPAWSRSGATHTMEDAALTIPLVIKLWYWGRGGMLKYSLLSSWNGTFHIFHLFAARVSEPKWGCALRWTLRAWRNHPPKQLCCHIVTAHLPHTLPRSDLSDKCNL